MAVPSRRGAARKASVAGWIGFALCEAWFRACCVGDRNIRVDWVLLLPPPLLLTAAGLATALLGAWRRRKGGAKV